MGYGGSFSSEKNIMSLLSFKSKKKNTKHAYAYIP